MNPKPLKMLFIGAAALAKSSGYTIDSDRSITSNVSAVKLRLKYDENKRWLAINALEMEKHVEQSQSESAEREKTWLEWFQSHLTETKERIRAAYAAYQAKGKAELGYTLLESYVTLDPINVEIGEVQRQLNVVLSLKRKFKELDHTYPDSLRGEKLKPKITMAFGKAGAATDATDTKKIRELADKLLKLRFMLSDFDDGGNSVKMPTEGIYKGSYDFDLVDRGSYKEFQIYSLPNVDQRSN